MPFLFLLIGIGFLVIAFQGTQATAFNLLKSEFSGPQAFQYWALALFITGALGYVPVIKTPARWFMVLILMVIVLKNKTGLFDMFNQQIKNPVAPAMPATTASDLGTGGAAPNQAPPQGPMPTPAQTPPSAWTPPPASADGGNSLWDTISKLFGASPAY